MNAYLHLQICTSAGGLERAFCRLIFAPRPNFAPPANKGRAVIECNQSIKQSAQRVKNPDSQSGLGKFSAGSNRERGPLANRYAISEAVAANAFVVVQTSFVSLTASVMNASH